MSWRRNTQSITAALPLLQLLFWVCTNSSIRCRDFPGGPVVKNLLCNVGNVGLTPGRETGIPHVMEKLSLHPVPSLNVKQGRESQEEAGRGRPGLCASSLRARRVVTLASDLIFASLSFLRCKTRLNNSSDLLGLLSEFSEIWLLRALLTQSLARSGCVKVSPCWY